MSNRKFDARHMSSTRDYQVQMTNWYEIQIAGVSEDITFMTKSINLPTIGTPVVELPYGNSKAKVAGQADFSDSNLVIRDAITKDVELQILEWQRQAYDPSTGKMGWVDQYKRDMTVTQFGPDGTCERVWKFIGAWPSNIEYGSMDHSNSDAKEVNLTISYDAAYREDM